MSMSIDLAFSKMFERETHLVYQRTGSRLRGTVRTKSGVTGSSTTFPKVGKGEAGDKARHGLVPVMNLDHSAVECLIKDKYAGEWIDKLDELKTNTDERGVVSQSIAGAMGRTTDDLIVKQLALTANSVTAQTGGAAHFRNTVLKARQALLDRDVPLDGNLFAAISPSVEAWMLTIGEFSSADYVGPDLPYKATAAAGVRSWLGINWIMTTALPKTGNNRRVFIYHKNAIGHAIQADMAVDVQWHNDRASHFVLGTMAQGAVVIDADGLQALVLDETVDLPTS